MADTCKTAVQMILLSAAINCSFISVDFNLGLGLVNIVRCMYVLLLFLCHFCYKNSCGILTMSGCIDKEKSFLKNCKASTS